MNADAIRVLPLRVKSYSFQQMIVSMCPAERLAGWDTAALVAMAVFVASTPNVAIAATAAPAWARRRRWPRRVEEIAIVLLPCERR